LILLLLEEGKEWLLAGVVPEEPSVGNDDGGVLSGAAEPWAPSGLGEDDIVGSGTLCG
jgi:hypothetical protein